jgi:hypothetical protein
LLDEGERELGRGGSRSLRGGQRLVFARLVVAATVVADLVMASIDTPTIPRAARLGDGGKGVCRLFVESRAA